MELNAIGFIRFTKQLTNKFEMVSMEIITFEEMLLFVEELKNRLYLINVN